MTLLDTIIGNIGDSYTPRPAPPSQTVTVDRLPPEARAIVAAGWHAVVYKGIQVQGAFPQLSLALQYIAETTRPGACARADFIIVSKT